MQGMKIVNEKHFHPPKERGFYVVDENENCVAGPFDYISKAKKVASNLEKENTNVAIRQNESGSGGT